MEETKMKKRIRNLLHLALTGLLGIAALTAMQSVASGQDAQSKPSASQTAASQEPAPGPAFTEAKAAVRRTEAPKYGLELAQRGVGWIISAEGGSASADVVTERLGGVRIQHKHLAGIKYDSIEIKFGAGLEKALYVWMEDTLANRDMRENGKIFLVDWDNNIARTMDFYSGLISEVGFPALDRASKDRVELTVKIDPEHTRVTQAGGRIDPVKFPAAKLPEAKRAIASNFRLTIDGLDCRSVTSIEPLVFKRKVVENPVGEMRYYEKDPANLEVPNLVITLPESQAQGFLKWQQQQVASNNPSGTEKKGTLEFLAPDLKTVIFQLDFNRLGFFKITPKGAGAAREITVSMYMESANFKYDKATNQ
jgi:hypothetical protein